jgi:hypothetical protein
MAMVFKRHINGVTYYQLTNFHRYQKIGGRGIGEERRGEEMIGDDLRREEASQSDADPPSPDSLSPPPPPLQLPLDSRSLRDRWMAQLAKWGLALKHRARAREAFDKNNPTEYDLRDWLDLYRLCCRRSCERKFPEDPKSFVRSLMARLRSPGEADVGFWKRRNGSGVPKDESACETREKYLSGLPEAMPVSELAAEARRVKA